MTRLGITYAEVALAAENLQLSGEKPTIERIRRALGDTGSHSTIAKYLQSWRENSPALVSTVPADGSPAVVQAAVQSVWQQLQSDATSKIKKLEEDIAVERLLMQDKLKIGEENLLTEKKARLAIETAFNGLSAEHELLKLEMKSINDAHLILQEKYQSTQKALEEARHAFRAQELLLREAQVNALKVLEEKLITQDDAHAQLLSELKLKQEAERHQLLIVVDEKRTLLQANEKSLKEKEESMAILQSKNVDLKIALETSRIENATLQNTLQKANERWTYFNDKVVASKDLIANCKALHQLKESLSEMIAQTHIEWVASYHQCKQDLLRSLEKEIRRSYETSKAT